ncbi:MAG: carbohydrate ABC transporter permease [Vallitaleaceae bacterium]|nr:carbohydrate ABC transporter permease [Vallitaleaceae bacterium]
MTMKKKFINIIIYIVLTVLMLAFFLPFILLVLNAFKTNAQIIQSPLSLPTGISFDNFMIAMKRMNFVNSFLNSLKIIVFSLVFIVLSSSMSSYYLVRSKSKLSKICFFTLVASMSIPFQAIMIPLVSIYGSELGLIQSYPHTTLIFMYIGFGAPLAIFIYHGFIKSIPLELEEAALIDGCNKKQMFFKIIFPILKPTTVTIAILDILWIWNDFLLPSLILQNGGPKGFTLPLAIRIFQGTFSSDYEMFLPAVLLVILPILFVYLFLQRFVIDGVIQGSIK